MALQAGQDYAFSRRTTWLFPTGVGKASALFTRNLVVIVPIETIGGAGRTVTTTTFTIGGQPVDQALARVLAAPDTTVDTLEAFLRKVRDDVPKGPVFESLADFKRIKVRGGFFGRAVTMSKRESGGWGLPGTVVSLRLAKDEVEQFRQFFQGDPRLV